MTKRTHVVEFDPLSEKRHKKNKKYTSEYIVERKSIYADWHEKDIIAITPEIEKLQRFQHLYICKNPIRVMPKELCSLVKLQRLVLSHNQLEEIPHEIGRLKQLEIFNVSYNLLKAIPREIGSLEKLVLLFLQHNQITSIPPELGNLQMLEAFYLEGNPINSIPMALGNLQNVNNEEQLLPENKLGVQFKFLQYARKQSIPRTSIRARKSIRANVRYCLVLLCFLEEQVDMLLPQNVKEKIITHFVNSL